MKTLIVSLAALVAVSGAALAAGGDDLRSSDTYFGKYSSKHKMEGSTTDSNAFAVVKGSKKKLTPLERMIRNAEENKNDSKSGNAPSI
jgi:hypothetical protein